MILPLFAIFGSLQNYSNVAILVFRVSVGILFLIHGIPKLSGETRREERKLMKGLGIPNTLFDLVATFEFLGGLFLVLGFLTRISSLVFALLMIMIVGFNITKMSKPPFNKRYINGWDRDTVLLTGVLLLAVLGPGIYSVDFFLGI